MAQRKNDSSAVLYARRGAVAWVTLNRPAQFNAYNMAMRDDLFQILAAIHDDREVRAMVLRGAGQAFSTGGDLAEFGMAPSPIVARWVRFRRDVWGLLRALPIPTIAAIHGYTVGGVCYGIVKRDNRGDRRTSRRQLSSWC